MSQNGDGVGCTEFDLEVPGPPLHSCDDDLAALPALDEQEMLIHIRGRFKRGITYTYMGDILLAVNPFRDLAIYDSAHAELYRLVMNRERNSLACIVHQAHSCTEIY